MTDPDAAAATVEKWWKGRGYSVEIRKYGHEYVLGGDAKNGLAITLHLDAGRTWLQTEGSCVPGDWKKASDDDIAHRRNEIVRTPTPAPTLTDKR